MIFGILALSNNGEVTANAKGHPTEVIAAFRSVCEILLSSRGPWRITDVIGTCPSDDILDSDMRWTLIAKSKDREV